MCHMLQRIVCLTACGEHRPAGAAEDVGGDAVKLDAGVLKRLAQPGGLPLRSRICVLRYRVRLRSRRIGLGGTKLARNKPASASWHSHAASETSVLRPETFLMCRALTSTHSKSS